jgi:hypothetical protein
MSEITTISSHEFGCSQAEVMEFVGLEW